MCMCVCKMRISSCRRRREFDFDLLDHRTKRPTVDLSPVAKDGAKSEVKVFVDECDDDDDDADSGVLSSIQTFHTAHTKEEEFSVPGIFVLLHMTLTPLEPRYVVSRGNSPSPQVPWQPQTAVIGRVHVGIIQPQHQPKPRATIVIIIKHGQSRRV